MDVAALQVGDLLHGLGGVFIFGDRTGQGDQNLVGVQARVPAAEVVRLERLDRFDGAGRDQISLLIDAGQLFQSVQQGRGCRTQQRAGLACDNRAVGQFNRSGRLTVSSFGHGMGTLFDLTLTQGNARLVHEQLELETFRLDNTAGLLVAEALEIPAHDLIQRRFTADIVINDAVACHVDAHICRRAIRALTCDQLKHCIHDRENLHIAVVVDRRLTVGFQMERVDHVDVVQIGGGGLVGQVDGMLEGQIPDGEGLELGVARLDTALVLMVELGQADRHLAAAGAGGRDDHQRALGLDVIVLAVAVIADDVGHVVGVAGNLVVAEGADAQAVEFLLKRRDLGRIGVLRHADAAHKQADALEGIDQAQHVHIVGDAVVTAHLVGDDVLGADEKPITNVQLPAREESLSDALCPKLSLHSLFSETVLFKSRCTFSSSSRSSFISFRIYFIIS